MDIIENTSIVPGMQSYSWVEEFIIFLSISFWRAIHIVTIILEHTVATMTLVHIIAIIILDYIIATVTLKHIVTIITLDAIFTFETTVIFVIPLVALMT